MPSTELVGPLPVVRFYGGPRQSWGNKGRSRPAVAYVPPKNTLDPRYKACTDHHVACDCREAEFAEQKQDMLYEWQRVREAFEHALTGHVTWSANLDGPQCECTACQLARELGIWSAGIQETK